MSDSEFSRRSFVRLCTAAVALLTASPALLARTDVKLRRYERARLIDDRDRSIAAAQLKEGENYIFHYPYVTTPCFLINLGKPAKAATLRTEDGKEYHWSGGVGPRRAIVAFAAICAHKMTHPAHEVSFINYRHEPASFRNSREETAERAQVIYCCSEKSVYDPVDGARVLGGPAKQPLTAIVLEQDKRGNLYAIGTLGGELYDKFFATFSSRLSLEFRTTDVRRPVKASTTVVPLSVYCSNQVLC
ncbi:MAG TPA: (2Fe-2S)-binding protein [Burkholderiales bacterium]